MYFIPPTVSGPNLCLHGAYAVGEKMDDEKKMWQGEWGPPFLEGVVLDPDMEGWVRQSITTSDFHL